MDTDALRCPGDEAVDEGAVEPAIFKCAHASHNQRSGVITGNQSTSQDIVPSNQPTVSSCSSGRSRDNREHKRIAPIKTMGEAAVIISLVGGEDAFKSNVSTDGAGVVLFVEEVVDDGLRLGFDHTANVLQEALGRGV